VKEEEREEREETDDPEWTRVNNLNDCYCALAPVP
jgi:hypothetical protein